jgi:ferrous iron transport protein B
MLLVGAAAAYLVTMPLMVPGFVLILVSDSVQGFLAGFTPIWFSVMIGDGLMGGLGLASIITGFIGAVFLVLGILENTGYLARLAYVFDPFMRRLGLHGKSVLPLIMGFVCNILGVAASRVIDTWRQRLATLIIAPIIPCKGLFIVVGFVTVAFFGGQTFPIILALALVTLLYITATAKLLKLGVLKGDSSGLIMELPHYQRPDFRTIVVYAWTRLKIFFFRGFWFVVFFSVLAWVGIYFPNGTVHDSYLAQFGKMLEPYGQIMGWEWRLCVSYIVAVFSKEGTLSAMAIIFGVTTATDTDLVVMSMDQNILNLVMQGGLTSYLAATGISLAGALSFIFAVFFSLPCFGTLAMIYSETKSIKWTSFTFVYYLSASLIMGMLAYRVGLLVF